MKLGIFLQGQWILWPIVLEFKWIFRVKQCRIYNGDHEVYPIHTLLDDEQCLDSRIDAKLLSIHRTVTLQYKTFRFTGLHEADQMQNINCTLTLEKSEVADGATVPTIPDCICHSIEDCDQYKTPEPTTTTVAPPPVSTIKTPEDEKFEKLQESASRMRGQFHQNSFTIMTDRSTPTSTKREICNGIRVDYQHILTRKECCEKNIRVITAGFHFRQKTRELMRFWFFFNDNFFVVEFSKHFFILKELKTKLRKILNGQFPSIRWKKILAQMPINLFWQNVEFVPMKSQQIAWITLSTAQICPSRCVNQTPKDQGY